jgi:hypothetical protein
MWPSLPKIVEDRYLGSAYGCIFFIQNIGLMLVPGLIGYALTAANPEVAASLTKGITTAADGSPLVYDYTVPELIFSAFGVLAFFLAFVLKAVDKKRGYGLDIPNKK